MWSLGSRGSLDAATRRFIAPCGVAVRRPPFEPTCDALPAETGVSTRAFLFLPSAVVQPGQFASSSEIPSPSPITTSGMLPRFSRASPSTLG
ncbi:hypothetical protein MTO96_033853 [Rhipicephalus appendiculatus]